MRYSPHHPLNDLARQRNRAAAERTLLSWIQNCLALIGFGTAFDQILSTLSQQFPDQPFNRQLWLTNLIALTIIGTGIFLLLLAIYQYQKLVRWLDNPDLQMTPPNPSSSQVALAIALFGFIAWFILFFQ